VSPTLLPAPPPRLSSNQLAPQSQPHNTNALRSNSRPKLCANTHRPKSRRGPIASPPIPQTTAPEPGGSIRQKMREVKCNALAQRQQRRGPAGTALGQRRPSLAHSRPVAAAPPRATAGPIWMPDKSLIQPGSASGPIQLGSSAAAGDSIPPTQQRQQATRRGVLRNALLLGAGLAACPCCTNEALASGNAKFEYGTLSGPISWGGVCSTGAKQSPIDIPRKALVASGKRLLTGAVGGPSCKPAELKFAGYKPVKPKIYNTGVGTMQVGARPWLRWVCGCGFKALPSQQQRTAARRRIRGSRNPAPPPPAARPRPSAARRSSCCSTTSTRPLSTRLTGSAPPWRCTWCTATWLRVRGGSVRQRGLGACEGFALGVTGVSSGLSFLG